QIAPLRAFRNPAQRSAHFAPGKETDAGVADAVIVRVRIAKELYFSTDLEREMLVDDERRGRARAGDRFDQRCISAVPAGLDHVVAGVVVRRAADEREGVQIRRRRRAET